MLSPASQKRHRKELLNEVLAVPYVSVTDHSMVSKRDLSSVDISSLNTKLRLVDQGDRFEKDGTIRDYQVHWNASGSRRGWSEDRG